MPEPHRDDPLERIRQLERENRTWKRLFFGLLSGLMGVLLLGGIGYGLHQQHRSQELKRQLEETRRRVEEQLRQVEEDRHRFEQLPHQARREPEPLKGTAP